MDQAMTWAEGELRNFRARLRRPMRQGQGGGILPGPSSVSGSR